MRGYVTKTLTITEVLTKAACLDSGGTIHLTVRVYGSPKIENNRRTFRMLERASGCTNRCIIYEIVSTEQKKTRYRMTVDDFIENAEQY